MEWSAIISWMSWTFNIVDKMVVTDTGHLLQSNTDSLQKSS